MELIVKLLDEAIYKYSRNPKPLPLEIVEDFQRIKKIVESMNTPQTPKVEEVKEQLKPKEEKKEETIQDIKEDTIEEPIEDIRKRYEEKFQKKPFMWWDRKTLLSKMA